MTRDEASAIARARLASLAGSREPGGLRDGDLLAEAAAAALDGDARAIATFRRVFDEPGFAVSASGMEVGYAALGLALLGDVASRARLEGVSMPWNGIDDDLRVARLLLAT